MPEHAHDQLSPCEERALQALRSRPGHTFTRDELVAAAQLNPSTELSRCIDAVVARIRRKLGSDAAQLRTVFGDGYCWGVSPSVGPEPRQRVKAGGIEVDLSCTFALQGSTVIPLTTAETRALRRLVEAGGQPVASHDLAPRGAAARVVLQLRRKLGPDAIIAIRGTGYSLAVVPQTEGHFRVAASEAAEVAGTTMGLPDVVVYQRDGAILEQVAAWGPKRTHDGGVVQPLRLPVGSGIVGWVARHGTAALVADTRDDARYVCDINEARAELAVPIVVRGNVVGVIDCESPDAGAFTQVHRQGLEAVAKMLSATALW